MPSGPEVTASRAASSVTMLKITSASRATSRGVPRQTMPRAMSSLALAALRFVPYTWWSWSRRPAIRLPMAPRPTKPIRVIDVTFPQLRG
jgi:hypothetical protein